MNDIGATPNNKVETVTNDLIQSYEEMIRKAKERNLRVFLGTISPFKGAGYYSVSHEAMRQKLNQWIRSQREKVDGILDFDELLRDPNEPDNGKVTGCILILKAIGLWESMPRR